MSRLPTIFVNYTPIFTAKKPEMKTAAPLFLALISVTLLLSCQRENINPAPVEINYHFATLEEGKQLILAHTDYYNSLTQNDLEWKRRKTGTTLDEYKAFAQDCVQDFTEKDKAAFAQAVEHIKGLLGAMGVRSLPFPDYDIVFIKTSMMEEGDAAAYTHKTEIYVCDWIVEKAETEPDYIYSTLAHELFHCLTRNSPDFRRKAYGLLGFTVTGIDHPFSPNIREMILANPDVEHYDDYAAFTINGQKRNCILLPLYTKSWEEAYAESGEETFFFDFYQTVLVPIDELDTWYSTDDVPDFWDVMGENTGYVMSVEECLADNFADAIVFGLDKEYKSPWLIEKILALLKEYK